ncbi:hypothetical protein AB2A76_003544 [Escherichia coli]|nr:hypothetical protein [Salmonella enterica]EDE2185685.1 hypothetical protein [Salmonella enterica]MDK6273715.1 hypothetical protein [Escherichia coli]HAO6594418.1 hypothetical protein [Escherichia coli]
MKKTLIALAVAASAVVSGSAMAWTAGGNGGSVEIGGTLTPETGLPWEVKIGSNIADLNAEIKKGQSEVDIVASKAIPVLGIRSVGWFDGKAGINPQINYGDAIDLQGFNREVTTLSLEVQNAEGNKIGSLTAPFFATAMRAYHKVVDGVDTYGHRSMVADNAGKAFFGGLNTAYYSDIEDGSHLARVGALDPEIVVNFADVGDRYSKGAVSVDFNEPGTKFNSFYGSGIEKDQTIKITLDSPAESDAIAWKASLPVVVSYQ